MWDLINAPQTEIFGIAVMLMLMLGVLEVCSLLLGGVSDWLDNMLPDSLSDAGHAEVGLDAADAGAFIRFLSWLYVGKLPVLMLMVVFLAVFGLLGYLLQGCLKNVFGFYLNGWLAAIAVWLVSLPVVRVTAGGLYRIMPKDETTAVEQKSLVGRVGVVVLGEARPGSPAEVRVKDGFGQQHYVMAEPDGDLILKQGEAVLLVALSGNTFKAIANPSNSLID
ncbi:MAG: YqiJ family protein [Neisseria sp.]|uniref:YqiJ family protein n=1 Tax=Neisseria sp. TaxID=192066 RepID=UPI0026DCA6D4|nr:YqiJ family protein [Neisseria sp.]MDO4640964.1 YqiJ family protein [Neisseria sp.]